MAPKTVTPSPLAVKPAAVSSEIVDSRTGEVVNPDGGDRSGSEALDAATLSLFSAGDLMARLEKAEKAKVGDFKELESDFWDPGTPGTPDAVLQGIFAGSGKNKGARIIQHAVIRKGADGKPVAVRFNGRHGLTTALKQVEPGNIVRIEYLGEKVSQGLVSGAGGNTFKEWKVQKITA